MSNSSSVDALAQQHQLGQLLRGYGWNQQLYRGYQSVLWISLVFIIISMLFLLGFLFLIFWIGYAWVVFRRSANRQPQVLCYEHGLIDRQKMQVIRYDEIATIQLSQVEYLHAYNRTGGNIANMRLDCVIKTKQGKKIKFQQYIENVVELGSFLQQQTLSFQLHDAIARLNQGESISFDSLKLSTHGIHQGKKLLPWENFDTTEVKAFTSHNSSFISVVVREKASQPDKYWAACDRNWFPNLLLFLTLTQHLRGRTDTDAVPQPTIPELVPENIRPPVAHSTQESHQFPVQPTVEKRPMREHLEIGLNATITPLAWWSVLIGCVSITGYPGVIMMTPLAWLILPFQAGSVYAETAIAKGIRPQLRYSALVGVFIGIILSLLCTIISWLFMKIPADEVGQSIKLLLVATQVSFVVCPLFSMLSTHVQKGWRLTN
jgi:hypothetical protein